MDLALVRMHFEHYFENFHVKNEIDHFACRFPSKAKCTKPQTEINRQSGQSQLFHEKFQNNVRNVFLQGLSPFKTDLECLNQFSEVFSVGQSSGFLDIFYVFPLV